MNAAADTAPPRPPFWRRARFWKRLGLSLLAILLLLSIALYWLMHSVSGRDLLLGQVVSHLPADATLTWSRIDGPVSGPLTLENVEFRYGDTHFRAGRLFVDAELRQLLRRRLQLDRLELRDAVLELPSSDEPFELPHWPQVLPQLELPLDIAADALRIDALRVVSGGDTVAVIEHAEGALQIGNGYLQTPSLAVDSNYGQLRLHGSYQPRHRFRTDLVATLLAPARNGPAPARLGLVARGDVRRMEFAVAGQAPEPLRIAAAVREGNRTHPVWTLHAQTSGLDLGLLGVENAGPLLSFDLQAEGSRGHADLQGQLARGDLQLRIEPSKLSVFDQVLTVEPLQLQVLDGRLRLRGRADFTQADDPRFKFAVNARGLAWGEDAQTRIHGDADLGVAGRLAAWAAIGKATLTRDGQQAEVDFDGRGDAVKMTLHTFRARMPTGTLDATGDVGWDPAMRWDLDARLDGFDPGYFLPGWDGAVSGRIASNGQARDAGGYDADFDVPALSGHLRGRALDGRGRFALHGEDGEGELALALGNSRVEARGTLGAHLDLDAQLQPLQLDDLLPDAGGTVTGTLKLKGPRDTPDIDAALSGSNLQWGDYRAGRVELNGRLPWRSGSGDLDLSADTLVAGVELDRLRLHATGAVENLQVVGETGNAMAQLALAGGVRRNGARWAGTLESLRIVPAKGDAWQLQQPASFAFGGPAWSLSQACLGADTGGTLCAQAEWPRTGLRAHADALPLTLVQPWLPRNGGRPLSLRGDIRLEASLQPLGQGWQGQLQLASAEGGIKLGSNSRGEIIQYDNFTLESQFDPQSLQARLSSGFKGNGSLEAQIDTGWSDSSPLRGEIRLENTRLFWMELFSPDLVRPRGKLLGHVGLAGTRGQPALSGEATLSEFTGELPALGVELVDGAASLTAQADGSALLHGSLKSASTSGGEAPADGRIDIDGRLDWSGEGSPLQLNVRGHDFLASDTSDLRVVVSPDVEVGFADGTLQVQGRVDVPAARIDVDKLDDGVSASADVVVLDPVDPERGVATPLDLDLTLALGDAVELHGYGLDGTLAGELSLRSRPGRDATATGQIRVDGRYTAYGQKLKITRGELNWSNDSVSDPSLRIRAEREVISANVTAGIDVRGRASRPEATVWSDPETTESEALAYLVLGRSLNTASTDESQQIDAASSALNAGAGLLASQLGAKLGLDDAGVLESRTLGGSVFGVGKYLSPRLYVSYGVSMVGEGSALTLKYLLRKGFDMEIESSTYETRGSLNWRKEK
ncbi:pathogenicity protein [Pseudoxanthomonas kalamensis DSM 18571]|uniref:translocation/assembly module TamB domain-containing protein n=1 Tax=Pseudoxanthomonas kalamensis TaxID=289483 RepID=UPI0013916B21|nr:translocation/assembly module TamB domain-containing protein [Pseudoxanthomonas kalamensis]KAF1712398.1 pathogenicity protein [Pseudoxanthomonas kalamensis DSM 18571]